MDPSTRLKNLNERASNFSFDTKTPVLRYLRSSKEMERMAFVYASEKEYENSFLLYMKMITLLVEKLPKHLEYHSLTADHKQTIRKRCMTGLQAAEKIKTVLRKRYKEEYEFSQAQELQKIEQEKVLIEQKKIQQEKEETKLVAPVPLPVQDLSLEDNSSSHDLPPANFQSYPDMPNVSSGLKEKAEPSAPLLEPSLDIPSDPPPSYETTYTPLPYEVTEGSHGIKSDTNPTIDRSNKPTLIDRSNKPTDLMFRQDSLDGNRKIIISEDLVPLFLQLAANNTQKNLETCGILTGSLSRNIFRITHLIIPKQSATPDSCTTESEEELFDVQDKYDLITLGWIHTHPTQTCFLSSVDLHTQCSYQQMLPEAIAIVCSPKYQTTGIYRLTLNHGLKFITSCSQTGFHPHPKEPPLFEDSPLVSVEKTFNIQVVDLRNK